jgi:hypothetical protein
MRLPEVYDAPPPSLLLSLNGWQSLAQPIGREWYEYTFELPAGVGETGLNDVWLHFSQVTTLPRPNPETPPLDITAISAGEEVGGFGHIFFNGYEVSPNERGYNVALRGVDGELAVQSFDTHLNPAEGEALTNFIRAATLPQTLIVVAAADEASLNLSEAAVHELQHTTGARGDLRGCFRCSQALIRTADGQTLEALDPLRPVGITTGLGLTEPRVAAVVDWVRVELLP